MRDEHFLSNGLTALDGLVILGGMAFYVYHITIFPDLLQPLLVRISPAWAGDPTFGGVEGVYRSHRYTVPTSTASYPYLAGMAVFSICAGYFYEKLTTLLGINPSEE
ncbi:hypothetical protein [Haloarchaeobius sp. TZWWS8]|uniref:hypothetical protein n=1 Tax=Haloarchaeobius sp. TZWWS8 TaxID=3446121 RepID=UPI003EB829E7